MAKVKLPSLEEATLLQRTLVYAVTFILGSAGFVAIASLLVVAAARAIIPSRATESSDSAADKVADLSSGKSLVKSNRFRKGKTAASDEVQPVEEHP